MEAWLRPKPQSRWSAGGRCYDRRREKRPGTGGLADRVLFMEARQPGSPKRQRFAAALALAGYVPTVRPRGVTHEPGGLVNLKSHLLHLVAVLTSGLVLAGCAGSNPVATESPTPLSSPPPAAADSLWVAAGLSYPDDILVATTADIGERSFDHRDLRVPVPALQLADASARYALLTDRHSQQLHVVDLRTGQTRVLLASPVSVRRAPDSVWAQAREALREEFGTRFAPTRILSAQVSGRRVVWQEALCITTGGFAVDAWALYAAAITSDMELGPARLIALAEPPFVPASHSAIDWPRFDLTLQYSLQDGRLLLIRGADRAEVADSSTSKRPPQGASRAAAQPLGRRGHARGRTCRRVLPDG